MKRNLTIEEKLIVNQISNEELLSDNSEIAKEVRLSGSIEELRAFQFIQKRLESFGLKAEIEFDDAYISIPIQSKLEVNGEIIDSITHSMAKDLNNEELSAECVYLQNLNEDSLRLVKNKIAIYDSIAIPDIVKQFEDSGVAGVIFINGPNTHEMIVSRIWGSPSVQDKDLLPKIPVISINNKNGEKLLDLLKIASFKAIISTEVCSRWMKIPRLIADIRGDYETDHFVLLCGHVDSWHYGAMDNGSANALMLQVVKILAQNKTKWKRNVRIAFWSGHSHGRYAGSAAYCDKNWEDLSENGVMHFYVDSVGGKGANIFVDSNAMAETEDIAIDVIGRLTDQSFVGKRYSRSADQSFWGTGIPSLYMGMAEHELSHDPAYKNVQKLFAGTKGGGFGWWWHTVEDTIDKIDPDVLRKDCEIYLLSLYKVLTDNIIPINPLKAVEEIHKHLCDYKEKGKDIADLSLSINRVDEIKHKLRKVLEIKDRLESDSEHTRLFNDFLLNISKLLVPINYVGGSMFEHDLASTTVPVPSLALIHLYTIGLKDEDYYLLQTAIRRQVNFLNYELKKVIREIDSIREILVEVLE
ncbi:M28 family peptidase [Psychrobacillus sp. L3]|uniref:M28 family peptidase n=1 Tax=Psychrobacillus sp. L3 TaxID=3236891 RepID=UPI0036F3C04A